MSTRILLVEDEPSLARGLIDILAVKGYEVVPAEEGPAALTLALTGRFDLILLDVMLPGLDGFEILGRIRKSGVSTPVILLTARGSEVERVRGFELGADDYVTKPFSVLELLGRVSAVLRRSQPSQDLSSAEQLTIGEVTVDLSGYTAERNGRPIQLPVRAFDILRVLAGHKGKAVPRDVLIREVWPDEKTVNDRTLTNLILTLRQTIELDPAQPRILKTVHRLGYRLDLP